MCLLPSCSPKAGKALARGAALLSGLKPGYQQAFGRWAGGVLWDKCPLCEWHSLPGFTLRTSSGILLPPLQNNCHVLFFQRNLPRRLREILTNATYQTFSTHFELPVTSTGNFMVSCRIREHHDGDFTRIFDRF